MTSLLNKINTRPGRFIAGTVIISALLLLSADSLGRGLQNQITSLLLLMTISVTWNLVGGFAGQFSLGHSIFVGIGSYATAVILTYFGTPLIPTILVAGLISAFIGVLLAYPLLRLRGPYLAVGSLGMALASYGWMINWDFTNASSSYNMPAQGLVDLKTIFVYTVVLAAVTILSVVILINSPLGLRLVALRDDEFGAASVGVRRVRTLIPVWALSGFLTGLMGALYAVQRGTLTVDSAFNIQFSLDAAIVSVLGGLGTVGGPIIGSFLVYYLRFFSDDFSNWALLIEAIILIVIVRFFPSGLVGMFRLIIEKARALIRR
jgi:branched-chain amino acid transport system permease protein